MRLLPLVVLLVLGVGSAAGLGDITTAVTDVSTSAGEIKTAILTILGVLVTVALAYGIVKGLQK